MTAAKGLPLSCHPCLTLSHIGCCCCCFRTLVRCYAVEGSVKVLQGVRCQSSTGSAWPFAGFGKLQYAADILQVVSLKLRNLDD